MSGVDPRTPCIIGVATHTWHPEELGGSDAPEPLAMWEQTARAAAADSAASGDVWGALDSLDVVFCQSWPYDDPAGRLAARLSASPRVQEYSGLGGTVGQALLVRAATRMLTGELDTALIVGAEALATARHIKGRDERPAWSHRHPERQPMPFEAPFHPSEVAHEVFAAWLTFATRDNARRAHRGVALDPYRAELAALFAPFTEVAAGNPDAWFRHRRDATELARVSASNRMVGYPYTKLLVSFMDVDMAAAVLVSTHERAEQLGVPAERRVYLRGWSGATDPVYVAEHPEPWRSPAMALSSREALRAAGVGIDDVAHLDLYSCFPSSVNFACDALGIEATTDRPLTVTGGLPYHGGPGSNYLTHSLAAMTRRLRADPGSYGLVSGVGMHMTKHAFGVYSTSPGPITPPDDVAVQSGVDAAGRRAVVAEHDGRATVTSYCVVHDRGGDPRSGLLVCDVADEPDAPRCYARLEDPVALAEAERVELVGRRVRLVPTTVEGPAGVGRVNLAEVL